MSRTKGAKDKKPRKRPVFKVGNDVVSLYGTKPNPTITQRRVAVYVGTALLLGLLVGYLLGVYAK